MDTKLKELATEYKELSQQEQTSATTNRMKKLKAMYAELKAMSNPIIKVLMERDDYSLKEAKSIMVEAKAQFYNYLNEGDMGSAEDICGEYFGLEPDYLCHLGVM